MTKSTKITDEQFVLAWLDAVKQDGGVQDVAESLGLTYNAVKHRTHKLRQYGVILPRIRSKPLPKKRVNDLNSMIARRLTPQLKKRLKEEGREEGNEQPFED